MSATDPNDDEPPRPNVESSADLAAFLAEPPRVHDAAAIVEVFDGDDFRLPPSPAALDAPDSIVSAIAVCSFDHAIGNIIEYIYPPLDGHDDVAGPEGIAMPDEWRFLPFLSLPDGCHNVSEDYSFFSLPSLNFGRRGGPTTLYGISMFRQVREGLQPDDLPIDSLEPIQASIQSTQSSLQSAQSSLQSVELSSESSNQSTQSSIQSVESASESSIQSIQSTESSIQSTELSIQSTESSSVSSSIQTESLPTDFSQCAPVQTVDRERAAKPKKPKSRNRVQKAVCVLSTLPLFGAVQTRLWPLTHAYFSEGLVDGWRDYRMIREFYSSLASSLHSKGSSIHEENLYQGLSVRSLVQNFGLHALTLVKLLLLEKRTLFCGLPVSYLCSTLLSVVSLLPGLLAWPYHIGPQAPDDRDDQQRLFAAFGFPLKVFRRQALLPYICLQQMDDLQAFPAFFGATSNELFNRALPPGVVQVQVDVEAKTVAVLDHALSPLLTLTAADRTFAASIVRAVEAHRENQWEGSEAWVRRQFQRYVCCLCGAASTLPGVLPASAPFAPPARHLLAAAADFDCDFVLAWFATHNFQQWRADVMPALMKRRIKTEPSLSFAHPAVHESGAWDQAVSALNKVRDRSWGWSVSSWFA